MRVGVYVPGLLPEEGGGHTFEQVILTSLVKLASQSRHEFIIFADKSRLPGQTGEGSFGNLKTVYLAQPTLLSKVRRRLVRVAGKCGLTFPINGMDNVLHHTARCENIEFLWFLTNASSPVEIPYIATVWDIQHRRQPWFPEMSYAGVWGVREKYYADYLGKAVCIITPNNTGMRELSFFYQILPERFRCLAHPVPEISYFPSAEEVTSVLQKYGIPPVYLFYPAQFWAHKNHANLLLALKYLREQYQRPIHLVLTGSDKGNRQYIQGLAKELGIQDQVHFPGFVSREELIALYRGALALVYVSLCGPENLPPLEAFACGCPVIVSNAAGAQEQFGDAALFVNGLKADEIALAIKRMEDDPGLRQSLIDKGSVRAKKYSGADYVGDVFKILDDFEPVRRNWV